MTIVDAHTHVFSDEMIRARARLCTRDNWFGLLYSNPNAAMANPEALIASMDQTGIARSVVCGFPWRDPGMCREHNAYLAEATSRFPQRLAWLAIVAPDSARNIEAALAAAFESGAAGVGEINADAQGFEFCESESLSTIANFCRDAEKPILVHLSEPVGHEYPGKGTATPARFLPFLEVNPGVTIVAAHWGGGLPFYELMPAIKSITRNVLYDSAATTYLYDLAVFRSVLDIVGEDRVLFASDFPVLGQARLVRRSERIAWRSEEERDKVMAANALRVFGTGVDA